MPFSFGALHEIAPSARRIEPEVPCDAYDMSAWPIRRICRTQAEIRYQFHTRNLEMADLIRVLARARPALTLTLLTFCLDDSSIELYRFTGGRTKKWEYPEARREFHWDRARAKFGLAGDDVYDDEAAEHWAEEEMLHEALNHWTIAGADKHFARQRRFQWWNRPRLRGLMTEQQLFAYEIAEKLKSKTPRGRSSSGDQKIHCRVRDIIEERGQLVGQTFVLKLGKKRDVVIANPIANSGESVAMITFIQVNRVDIRRAPIVAQSALCHPRKCLQSQQSPV